MSSPELECSHAVHSWSHLAGSPFEKTRPVGLLSWHGGGDCGEGDMGGEGGEGGALGGVGGDGGGDKGDGSMGGEGGEGG